MSDCKKCEEKEEYINMLLRQIQDLEIRLGNMGSEIIKFYNAIGYGDGEVEE